MIVLRNVTKIYQNRCPGITDLSLTVQDGDFVFLVGKSGSGKSTILRLITGEEVPTSGMITVNNVRVDKVKGRKLANVRRTIGVVYQDFRLLDNLTVKENIEFAMKCVRSRTANPQRRIEEVLSLVQMNNKRDRFPGTLSGGEQQRVCIARALVNNPSLILADEPTGNLDPELSKDIMDLFVDLHERIGTTMIVISHERSLISGYNKRICDIDQTTNVEVDAVVEEALAFESNEQGTEEPAETNAHIS